MKKTSMVLRFCLWIMVCASLLLCLSCGYHVGSMMHPQIKTVGIADVKNESREVLASAMLRSVLAERFQFDNSLKVVQPQEADCIVYARILGFENVSVIWRSTDNEYTFRPSEFRLTASVEYTVLIPGQAKPLVPKSTVSGSVLYQTTNDPAIGRQSAIRQAFLQVANSIVIATTEGW